MATESKRAVQAKAAASMASRQTLPDGFQPYATQPLGGDHACVAGAVTDRDGTHQRPVVALATGNNRVVAWARHLDGLEDAYQARATHCVLGGNALYVLLQTDTESQRTLSQTLLSITRLDLEGEVLETRPVHVPAAAGRAYSAYVDEVPGDFRWSNGRLYIKGHYFLMSNPEAHMAFAVDVGPDLEP